MSDVPPLRLRVTDAVRPGVLATGVVVSTGAHEHVLNFVQHLEQPPRVVARVIVPRRAMPALIDTLERSILRYAEAPAADAPDQPGAPAAANQPAPPFERSPEVFDDLKLPEALEAGVYANSLLVGTLPDLVRLDFIAQLLPDPMLTARLFITPVQARSLLATWKQAAGKALP